MWGGGGGGVGEELLNQCLRGAPGVFSTGRKTNEEGKKKKKKKKKKKERKKHKERKMKYQNMGIH